MINLTTYCAQDLRLDVTRVSQNAVKVITQLQQAGYSAYLVGGCVRDLMLGLKPKDFDVATDAKPEQIKTVLTNSRIIGRRFKLVHARFGKEVIEVATFRAGADSKEQVSAQEMAESEEGRLIRDNIYGTIEDDVQRRDFTANALYFDPVNSQVLDYFSSVEDINAARLVSIGDTNTRFREDPVRMLRVIRFAAKLNFTMPEGAKEIIEQEATLLSHVSSARLFDEVLKLFHGGAAYKTFMMLREYGLFKLLFPFTDHGLLETDLGMPETALKNTDKRIQDSKPVIPAFLFACMMWEPIKTDANTLISEGMPEVKAWRIAMQDGLRDQNQYVAIPKRLAEIIIDIWEIHFRLIKRNPSMIKNCLNSRRFRAAYDFLLLRTNLHEVDESIVTWWTDIQEADDEQKTQMITDLTEVYRIERMERRQQNEADGNSVNYKASKPYNNNHSQHKKAPYPSANKRRRFSPHNKKSHNQAAGHSRNDRPYEMPSIDEGYGNASENKPQKKVKVRTKRKIINRPIKAADESPHF